jgi:glycosyltransferase involved in cell wall biosynthesis
MKYIWLGKHLNSYYSKLFALRGYKDPAAYSSQKNFIQGLRNFIKLDTINLINFPFNLRFLFVKSVFWEEDQGSKNYTLPSLNIPFLNRIFSTFILIFKIKDLLVKNKYENFTFFVYNLQSITLLSLFINKIFFNNRIKIIILVPDLPMFMGGKNSLLRAFLKTFDWILIRNLLKCANGLLIYSKHMVEYLHFFKKPIIVIEGSINLDFYNNLPYDDSLEHKDPFIFYSGKLDKNFSIDVFLKSIPLITSNNIKFYISGYGSMEKVILELMKTDNRLFYLGYLDYIDVIKLQQKALINLNLRNPDLPFSKYSFPSKLMELMITGKPVLTPLLEGIPEDYYPYLFVIEKFNPMSLANCINQIINKKDDYLSKPLLAKKFIISKKNNRYQSLKLLSFAKSIR